MPGRVKCGGTEGEIVVTQGRLPSPAPDASILVYKFRPKRTGFNMYAEYTRPQLTFLALHPCVLISRNAEIKIIKNSIANLNSTLLQWYYVNFANLVIYKLQQTRQILTSEISLHSAYLFIVYLLRTIIVQWLFW